MANIPERTDTGSRIDRLERAVRKMQTQSTLSSASISEGNLTIRRGGSLRIIDGGSILGEGEGSIDWEGDAHFGGDLSITGDTAITGTLELQEGIIGPGALSLRTEATTRATTDTTSPSTANSFNLDMNVPVPDWAQSVSISTVGTVHILSAESIFAMTAVTTIDGDVGTETGGATGEGNLSIPTVHGRDLVPGAGTGRTIPVRVRGGLQGAVATGTITSSMVVTAIFNN